MIKKVGKFLLKVVAYIIVFMVAFVGFGFDKDFDIAPWRETLDSI